MKLHIFNPGHDLALASGLANFTAPHAARLLAGSLGYLPLLWAGADDIVLVEDPRHLTQMPAKIRSMVALQNLTSRIPSSVSSIEPWGWDAALRAYLLRKGVSEHLLPTQAYVEEVRLLSHRREAARLLPCLRMEGTIGEAVECDDAGQVAHLLEGHDCLVLKAPWSSSGRGLRYLNQHHPHQHDGWLRNLLAAQGSVMVEPYYPKVKDFAMLFYSDGLGYVRYLGLSVFQTKNGAYTGNLLATERRKEQIISKYLTSDLLSCIRERLCDLLSATLGQRYEGPLGIDMMVVPSDSIGTNPAFLLHPCVEMNLRRTMGHVALSLTRMVNPTDDDDVMRVMRIVYEGNNYKLKIQRL